MKYCTKCGTKNRDENEYCYNCGHKFRVKNEEENNSDNQNLENNNIETKTDTNIDKNTDALNNNEVSASLHKSGDIRYSNLSKFCIIFFISIILFISLVSSPSLYKEALSSNKADVKATYLTFAILFTIQEITSLVLLILVIYKLSHYQLVGLPLSILVLIFSSLVSGIILLVNYSQIKDKMKRFNRMNR